MPGLPGRSGDQGGGLSRSVAALDSHHGRAEGRLTGKRKAHQGSRPWETVRGPCLSSCPRHECVQWTRAILGLRHIRSDQAPPGRLRAVSSGGSGARGFRPSLVHRPLEAPLPLTLRAPRRSRRNRVPPVFGSPASDHPLPLTFDSGRSPLAAGSPSPAASWSLTRVVGRFGPRLEARRSGCRHGLRWPPGLAPNRPLSTRRGANRAPHG